MVRRPEPRLTIGVIGGGPAGLYFARLIRRWCPASEVDVYERNPAEATFGFGVGFAGHTLHHLEAADPETHRWIVAASRGWDGMSLRHGGELLTWSGFGMRGISRITLLKVLQRGAADAGARLHFGSEVTVKDLADRDVIVAADGMNSSARREGVDEFGTTTDGGPTRHMWLGAAGPFERTTFSVRTDEAGTFALHSYPYAPDRVTIVAETDEAAWRRAGFERHAPPDTPGSSDEWSVRYLERLFAPDLEGHSLLTNSSRWMSFLTIRSARWWSGKVVLLGDAAHTAHPSVGAGTQLAMEGAIVLARELAAAANPSEAFERYEAGHRPLVERIQLRAVRSHDWWGTVGRRSVLTASQLTCSYMTRTGAVGYEQLLELAPAVVEATLAQEVGSTPGGPLELPLEVGGKRLPGRLLVSDGNGRASPATPAASPASVAIIGGASSFTDLLDRVGVAVRSGTCTLVAAELPVGEDTTPELLARAAALRDAGCYIVALPAEASGHGHERAMPVSERIRLELGIATLAPVTDGDLDRAASDILAGRVDLVSVPASVHGSRAATVPRWR